MIYIFQILFILILLLYWKGSNNCYKIFVMFQIVSFVAAPLVANRVIFDTPLTWFNTLFCLLNLYLIIAPWRKTKFETLEIDDSGFFGFYKKILYAVLRVTMVNNLIVLIIVRFFISDAAVFKARLGFTSLYDSIPYFGLLFRYTSVSRYLGLLALPICIYYLKNQSFKQALKAFLMSMSTLIAAFAYYSRAQIFSYIILCVCLYFYVERIFNHRINRVAKRLLKYITLAVAIVFISITVGRFSSSVMSSYGDRIPQDSYIKSPVLYSVFDYTSKGFPNGIMQLEVHETKDVLKGEPIYSDLMMMLSYFHLTSWNKDDYAQRLKDSYNKTGLNAGNDSGTFHGYTCRMVKTMGYVCTLLVGFFYYRYVRRKSIITGLSLKSLSILVFLLCTSINSIFYIDFTIALYPSLFYLITSTFYSLSHHRIVIRKHWNI